MATTERDFVNEYYSAYDHAQLEGVSDSIAYPYAVLSAYLLFYTGRGAPRIISGFRSLEYQASLARRWERGERVGLVSKPARQSWHTVGRAIDVDTSHANYGAFRDWWKGWYGNALRVGEEFGDRGHFDIPGSEPPPVAY